MTLDEALVLRMLKIAPPSARDTCSIFFPYAEAVMDFRNQQGRLDADKDQLKELGQKYKDDTKLTVRELSTVLSGLRGRYIACFRLRHLQH